MRKFQIIMLSLLLGTLLLFAIQNTEQMQVHFLFWKASAPRVLIVASFFFSGLLFGLFAARPAKPKSDRARPEPTP